MPNDAFKDFAGRCRTMALQERDHRLKAIFLTMARDYERRAQSDEPTAPRSS